MYKPTTQTYKYRHKDKMCTLPRQEGVWACTRSIRYISNVRYTEETFKRQYDVSYRFWYRPADSLSAEPTRNKRPLFRRVIALPRTILISRLPIKFLRRRPSEVTKLYGPLLIFMARK